MKTQLNQTAIVSNEECEAILAKSELIDIQNLSKSGKVLITYTDESTKINNTCVAISAAVTAYAIIGLSPVLVEKPYNIFAIDTDGIKINKKLDPKYLSEHEMGKLKLEYMFDKAVYLKYMEV